MSDFLTAVSTKTLNIENVEAAAAPKPRQTPSITTSSPEGVIEALSSQPDQHSVLSCLRYLDRTCRNIDTDVTTSSKTSPAEHTFNIHYSCPETSRILFLLINEVLPQHWDICFAGVKSSSAPSVVSASSDESEARRGRRLLKQVLSSFAGVSALLAPLGILRHETKSVENTLDLTALLRPVLELLDIVIRKDSFVFELWTQIQSFKRATDGKRLALWKESVNLLAGGKIVSLAAEAETRVSSTSKEVKAKSWIGDGKQYSSWLGRNLRHMLQTHTGAGIQGRVPAAAELLGRARSLGYEGLLEP